MNANPDLVDIAMRDVVSAAKAWAEECRSYFAERPHLIMEQKLETLLAAVTLLESREAMAATVHLDSPQPLYCNVDGTLLNEDGECPRCQQSAADEQRADETEDMEYEL